MKLSDYLIGQLADWGVRHIFLVTGGGAMHLNDSIGKEARIQFVCNHHEQASAMAAEAYARVSGLPGVVNVTTDRAASTRSTGSSGRGPTPFRCWSSPARSSVKPACARWGSRACANSETRKPTSSPWSRTLPNMQYWSTIHFPSATTSSAPGTSRKVDAPVLAGSTSRWMSRHVHRSRDASRLRPCRG